MSYAIPQRPFDFRRLMLLIFAVWMIICLSAGLACCDEIEAAKKRLQEIERAKPVPQVIDTIRIVPVPDPISQREPTIEFLQPARGEISERLPRAVLVCGQYCSPCLRMEQELEGLVGGPDMPIQVVKNWLANDLEEWGIVPSMQLGTPYLFILQKDGKVHSLTPNGLGCVLRGYQSKDTVLQYLAKPEHGVSIDVKPLQSSVTAEIDGADLSDDSVAAALAAHLLECAGKESVEWGTYGSLFAFDVDVNDDLRAKLATFLSTQRLVYPKAGLTLDWTGPTRTFSVSADGISISPPVKATVHKWLITYTCSLNGFKYQPDLSSVTVLLTGAPDLTVRLR